MNILDPGKAFSYNIFMGTPCPYCEEELTRDNFTVDHVIPKSDGLKFEDSMVTMQCCKDCNQTKQSENLLSFLGLIKGIDIVSIPKKIPIDDRVKTLTDVSGLKVTKRKKKNQIIYAFFTDDKEVISMFTYPKALLFAKGVQLGRIL